MSFPTETTVVPDQGRRRSAARLSVLMALMIALLAVVVGRAKQNHETELDTLHRADSEKTVAVLVDVLAKMPENRRLPALLEYVQDASPALRYAAVDKLGSYDSPEGTWKKVHSQKIQHDPRVLDAVEQAFQDSAAIVRQRALEVMPTLDPDRGLRLQLAALRDEDSWIREAAVTQLSVNAGKPHAYVDKRAIPMLMKTLDDPDESVPPLSFSVLRKLTGQTWRLSVKADSAHKQAVIAQCRQWWTTAKTTWPTAPELEDVPPIRPTRTDPAPSFALPDVNGKMIRLEDQKGRVTLLNFWGTWCPPCQGEIPDLIRVDQAYRGRNVDVIGIALSEKSEELTAWCHKHGVEYRQALATPNIQDDYGDITEVPVSLLIDKQGRVRYRWEGERDFATFNAAVDRLQRE